MYHVTVRNNGKIIADTFVDRLSDAVLFGRDSSQKGNRINIFEATQDATGQTLDLHKVLSLVVTE